mmetsp:Transcript_35922/g.53524  ORF Transcript_35922/g.53524 Transcript_35922/m.53524 type:complete len:271 (-) Transcript_35922:27-839(-)
MSQRSLLAFGFLFRSVVLPSATTTVSATIPRPTFAMSSPPKRNGSSSSSSTAKFASQKIVRQDAYAYAMKVGLRESPAAKSLREASAKNPRAGMMGDPIESSFFALILPAIGAKKIIEVGVFTGYSTLVMAEALPDDGKVLALDITDEYLLDEHWPEEEKKKIDLQIGPAVEALQNLCSDESELGTWDFAFIDADKQSYEKYYELLLKLLRPGGIMAIDNVLWSGRVLDTGITDDDTVAIRNISEHVMSDDRVAHVLLPFADGVTLVRKK